MQHNVKLGVKPDRQTDGRNPPKAKWPKCLSIIIIISPLTARVVGAPQMILQPVFSIFPGSPLPSGTCRTPGLSFPWCCLPTSSFVHLGKCLWRTALVWALALVGWKCLVWRSLTFLSSLFSRSFLWYYKSNISFFVNGFRSSVWGKKIYAFICIHYGLERRNDLNGRRNLQFWRKLSKDSVVDWLLRYIVRHIPFLRKCSSKIDRNRVVFAEIIIRLWETDKMAAASTDNALFLA